MAITHEERMQKKKTVIDSKIADAQEERGVLVINTGPRLVVVSPTLH